LCGIRQTFPQLPATYLRIQNENPENDVFLSAVSVWEIAVKHALWRLPLADPPPVYIPREREKHGISSLSLSEAAALELGQLPSVHQDPFDRMLVCQARSLDLVLLTPDPLIRAYPVATAW